MLRIRALFSKSQFDVFPLAKNGRVSLSPFCSSSFPHAVAKEALVDQKIAEIEARALVAEKKHWLEMDEAEDSGGKDLRIGPQVPQRGAGSIDDVEYPTSRPVLPDRTPGKYDQVKSMITRYRSAPRALYQKELVNNGLSPESAKKYADMLEERGMDTEEKVQVMLRRIRPRFPKLGS